ncbi:MULTISPECIES: alpha/beta hydrolase [Enorma]|uniref:alpha/beta hydrolase n=1 Tax=Enorma TaxID=1472762 RepID=UPI000345CB33|nr:MULTISPECIES: alpha/beta hydrolase-fold protein [Enorma]
MARLSVDYYSPSLMRTTTLDVILPIDDHGAALALDTLRRNDPAAWERTPYLPEQPPFKTLFLLHGMSGNHRDFISETRIRTWAEQRGLAVVMPSGYNAFYLDHPDAHNYYGRFVGEELVEVARRMFPLSRRREDTFIGGISMGAYGALRNGFKYAENFGCIIALSSAMLVGDFNSVVSDDLFFLSRPFLESVFGDLNAVVDSDKDPRRLAADVVYCDRPRPRVFMAWGSSDPLAAPNRELATRLRDTGIDVEAHEMPGGHDWDFWNVALPQALDWLPLG